MKKIISVISLLLVCIICCSCGAFQVKNVAVIASVNGEDILEEEYKFYLLIAQQTILSNAGESAYSEDFWTTTEIDGKTAGELAKENALDEAIRYTLIAQKAKAAGISADTAEAKEMISADVTTIQSMFEPYGFSRETLTAVFEKMYCEQALLTQLKENGEIDLSEEVLKKTYEESFRTIKHILISLTDPQDGSEMYTAEEAYQMAEYAKTQLDEGTDFDELMNNVSMDPGLSSAPNGYTFANNGTMVASFEDAAFSLEIGEISDIVNSSYGSHILKREPLIPYEEFLETDDVSSVSAIIEQNYVENLVSELKAKSTIEKNEKVYGKVSLF